MANYRIYPDESALDGAAKSACAKVVKVRLVGPAIMVETSESLTASEKLAVRAAILEVREAFVEEA